MWRGNNSRKICRYDLRSAALNGELIGERDDSAEEKRAQAGSGTVLVQGRRGAKVKWEGGDAYKRIL
jgi:hypothetical protein